MTKLPMATTLRDLQNVYNTVVNDVNRYEKELLNKAIMKSRTIKEVHYNNGEMTIVYNDDSKRVFSQVAITDIAIQDAPGRTPQAEIVYNFSEYTDDFGKYVESFDEGE